MTSAAEPLVPDTALQSAAQKRTPSVFIALGRDDADPGMELESARDAYMSEHEQDAARIAQDLVTRLRRTRGTGARTTTRSSDPRAPTWSRGRRM